MQMVPGLTGCWWRGNGLDFFIEDGGLASLMSMRSSWGRTMTVVPVADNLDRANYVCFIPSLILILEILSITFRFLRDKGLEVTIITVGIIIKADVTVGQVLCQELCLSPGFLIYYSQQSSDLKQNPRLQVEEWRHNGGFIHSHTVKW